MRPSSDIVELVQRHLGSENTLYFPGLRTDPCGSLGQWLVDVVGATPVALEPLALRKASDVARAHGAPLCRPIRNAKELFAAPLAIAREAVRAHQPRLIVARSFGAAILMELMHRDGWRGATVMIAGAANKLTTFDVIPSGCPTILVHGRRDRVVEIEWARALAERSGRQVQLWEVDDDHGLASIESDGTLALAIWRVLNARVPGHLPSPPE